MQANTIILLEPFDSNITKLNISESNIEGILDLSKFTQLEFLNCEFNSITSIINFPPTLKKLYCGNNHIETLDNLQHKSCTILLEYLNCEFNKIKQLDNLPNSLAYLDCSKNLLTNLDFLPVNLEKLILRYNDSIQKLDLLPQNLKYLDCMSIILITNLDNLPQNLNILKCINCKNLKSFNYIPNSLKELHCSNNILLPNNLSKELVINYK